MEAATASVVRSSIGIHRSSSHVARSALLSVHASDFVRFGTKTQFPKKVRNCSVGLYFWCGYLFLVHMICALCFAVLQRLYML